MNNSLLEAIQQSWIHQLTNTTKSTIRHLFRPTAYDGITVYEDSCHTVLFNHLKTTFPLCLRLVGQEFWYALLHRFISLHPSCHYDLNNYGDCLAQFIAEFDPAKTVPYLVELAQVEWYWHSLKNINSQAAFDFESFSQLDNAAFSKLKFHLSPGLEIIASLYPIYQILEMNFLQESREINIANCPENIIIYQHNSRPCLMLIDKEEYQVIHYLRSTPFWEDAVRELSKTIIEDRLSGILTKALYNQWISHYTVEEAHEKNSDCNLRMGR